MSTITPTAPVTATTTPTSTMTATPTKNPVFSFFSNLNPFSNEKKTKIGGKTKKRRYHKKGGWEIQKKKAISKSNTIRKRKNTKY
jgi:hypothetical protein